MLGNWLKRGRPEVYESLMKVASNKKYDVTAPYQASGSGLPKAPANPYKKRPMKLTYDKNDYHFFRLPSEQSFLLGSYDIEDIFGKRKGIEHSPYIKAQLNFDSNLVWFYFLFTMLAFGLEIAYHDDFVTLRENYVNSDMGKFEYDNFK